MTLPAVPPDEAPAQSELEFIAELCAVVAEQSELQPILDWLVHRTSRLLAAEECTIKLVTAGGDVAKTIMFDNRRAGIEAGSSTWSPVLKTLVMGYLMTHPGELASADLPADARFPALRTLQTPVRAMLALPLKVDGRITGMVAVSNAQPGREWTRLDAQLLGIVASHSAGVIEKARLRTEEEAKRRLEREREALDKELNLARDIQQRLIPREAIHAGRWRIEGRLVPAKQVGGDFFDYFAIDPGRTAFVIADVAGKGVPAALLVSTVQSAVRAFADGHRTPPALVAQLNDAVVRSAPTGKFVTFFYGELDHATGTLRYVNAGHNHPRLRRADGSIAALGEGGLPLGLFPGGAYAGGETAMAAGDALFLFSDGLSEAMDSFQQEFGEDRLETIWAHCDELAGADAVERIMREVIAFRGDAPQSDDMTAVVVSPA